MVRARINASGVSGLDTLLSGAYIGLAPIRKEPKQFKGPGKSPSDYWKIPGKHLY
ncbi:MAG: hypothetical protein H0A75_05250 [Candidatus Methanofishera endochildressiae]|uniref:Uncharacterized protein n=1 Tax=Candidatus Methanofishera endochildressiae TaxID=2738884 RepID=A0A7Z0MNS5_9GAMM|nr:hypothetical protein [Candidatus Methanofishera endochildressiae]